jgi:hypothetical protein
MALFAMCSDTRYEQYMQDAERDFTLGPAAHTSPLINGAAQDRRQPRLLQPYLQQHLGDILNSRASAHLPKPWLPGLSSEPHEGWQLKSLDGKPVALGAERSDVPGMILRQGLALILAGVVLGIAGAWATTRAWESLLFQVHARDAATFGGACLVLIVVSLLACYLPARRATKVDPMVALRYE